jgi:hypothetical protein
LINAAFTPTPPTFTTADKEGATRPLMSPSETIWKKLNPFNQTSAGPIYKGLAVLSQRHPSQSDFWEF